jgi:hypothetical protein
LDQTLTADAAVGMAHNTFSIFSILTGFPRGKVIKMIKAIKISDISPCDHLAPTER